MNIAEVLTRNSRREPNKEFLVEITPSKGQRRSLTYGQFNQRVNKLANALIHTGIKKGDMVLLFMTNSIEWVEAYFGIIKTGAVVVPLNFRFTGAEVEYATDVAKPPLLILEEGLADRVSPVRSLLPTIKDYICLGKNIPTGMKDYEEFIAGFPTTEPDIEILDEDNCGLYFTSGTTGRPKPILLSHKNLFMEAVRQALLVRPTWDGNFVAFLPLYHSGSFGHFLGYLLQGAKCTILKEFSPQNLLETIEREKGSHTMLVVPTIVAILEAQNKGEINVANYDLSSWRLIDTGSQAYPQSVLEGLLHLFPHVRLHFSFGLGEGTGPSDILIDHDDILRKPGSIGKPVPMNEARVVDEEGKDVAPGEVGELVVRSPCVMKEYYKNPEETAKTIKDGWLYTGDMARVDEDGYYYIVDRKKDVIISGGENVYPVEVEDKLQEHPRVLESAVIGVPDERFGERVMAIVKLKPGEEMTEEEFLDWCKENFPSHKRPRQVAFGDIPRNPTGKILKPELRLKYSGKREAV